MSTPTISATMIELEETRKKLRRLQRFVEPMAYCPCCLSYKICVDGCTLASEEPDKWHYMTAARKALADD